VVLLTRRAKRGFIWLKKPHYPNWKVTVTRADGTVDDVTGDATHIEWTKIATVGVGSFKVVLANWENMYSERYSGGEAVTIYADNADATRVQFKGILEFIKRVAGDAYSIELIGRHISRDLLDIVVTKSYENQTIDTILKNLIDTFLTGFTYNNVEAQATTATVNWSGKPFIECVYDLCVIGSCDFYVDDDKDFHFFRQGSRHNRREAVVEGDTLIESEGLGDDFEEEVRKIVVQGEDENGQPIIYTATFPGAKTNKELIIKDTDIKTYEEARDRAKAEIENLKAKFQGKAKSLGLETINPGESIYITIPSERILDKYFILEVRHEITGTWFTEITVQREARGIPKFFRDQKRKDLRLETLDNPNRLEFTYSLEFNDERDTLSHSRTELLDGELKIVAGYDLGTFISKAHEADKDISQVELRVVGSDLASSSFHISVDNGASWERVLRRQLHNVVGTGRLLKIKIILKADSANPNPRVDSVAILYK